MWLQRCNKRGIEHDAPIQRYYERLATVQARGSQASHQVVRDILKEAQTNMVPRGLLKEWAVNTFLTATDYWTFRKTVSLLSPPLPRFTSAALATPLVRKLFLKLTIKSLFLPLTTGPSAIL